MLKLRFILLIFKNFLFLLLLGLYITNIVASGNDHLSINSENLNIDRINNIANFKGEVILWFDDIVLKTDEITIYYKKDDNDKNSIDKIIIPYKLGAYNHQTDEVVIANEAKYFHDQAKLILFGNVNLQRQNNILKTSQLIYYTKLKQSFSTNK